DVETHFGPGAVARHGEHLDLAQPHVRRQVHRVDGQAVALPGIERGDQQQAVVTGGADQAVLQLDRDAADIAGRHHREGVVDAARGEHVAAHQHQPAVGAGVAVPVAGGTGDATVDPAV